MHLKWFDLHRRRALPLATGVLAMLALLQFSTMLPAAPAASLSLRSAALLDADGGARAVSLAAMRLPEGHGTLRLVFEAPAGARGPMALHLSGLFSADVIWNGRWLGSKGRPADAAPERPGPIDAVIAIPPDLIHPGDNVVDLRLSTRRPLSQSIIHWSNGAPGIRVAPYEADARRPITHYGAPLLMLGGLPLVVFALSLARPLSWRLLLLPASLWAAAAAEISRSLINYPYILHDVRTSILAAAFAGVGFACAAAGAQHVGTQSRRTILSVAAAAILLASVSAHSADERAMAGLCVGAAIGLAATLRGAFRRSPESLHLGAAFTLLLAFAWFDQRQFLDRSVYAAAAPLLAFLSLGQAPQNRSQAPTPSCIWVGAGGKRRSVPLAAIRAIHGAGNYTEFELRDGQRLLDGRKIDELARLLPSPFFRVHRSHIVSLDEALTLRSLGGGKAALTLRSGAQVAVARSRAGALKAALDALHLPDAIPTR